MRSLKIVVATHKPYWMPSDDTYVPLWVGADLHTTGQRQNDYRYDNEGDNISLKNNSFCELTGLYWAWKNLSAEYLGLSHYRRYFSTGMIGDKRTRIASGAYLCELLETIPAILPVKRNYFIETNYSQYVHAHHEKDLVLTRQILSERCPQYLPKYDECMGRTTGHRFNMFVLRLDLFESYCEWLFDLLFELEGRLDVSDYSANDKRVFGFVSERLIDPWIETNGIDYKELPIVSLENQHWLKKGADFLKRKYARK